MTDRQAAFASMSTVLEIALRLLTFLRGVWSRVGRAFAGDAVRQYGQARLAPHRPRRQRRIASARRTGRTCDRDQNRAPHPFVETSQSHGRRCAGMSFGIADPG
jgi:hypothetical protein